MAKVIELSKEAILHIQEDTKNIRPGRSMEEVHIAYIQRDTANAPPVIEPVKLSGRKSAKETLDHEIKAIKGAWNGLKIGEGHLKAMFKLGAHELTAALQALPDSNIRPLEEPGVAFNETMPHIVHQESDYEQTLQQYASRGSSDTDRSRTR